MNEWAIITQRISFKVTFIRIKVFLLWCEPSNNENFWQLLKITINWGFGLIAEFRVPNCVSMSLPYTSHSIWNGPDLGPFQLLLALASKDCCKGFNPVKSHLAYFLHWMLHGGCKVQILAVWLTTKYSLWNCTEVISIWFITMNWVNIVNVQWFILRRYVVFNISAL